jgi:hypothetical protein
VTKVVAMVAAIANHLGIDTSEGGSRGAEAKRRPEAVLDAIDAIEESTLVITCFRASEIQMKHRSP